MDGYGQFCPVALAAEMFARRWTPLIVRELLCGSTRFNDLRRGVPNISASVLSRRLDELAVAGIIERYQDENGMRYLLTTAGEELRPAVEALGLWGRRWLPTEYREQDLDPRLLVWDIHRNVHLNEISQRTVIELCFPDAPNGHRAYWLVLTPDDADVCLVDPGGEVDLHLVSDVRTLADIWMGNLSWASALRAGTLKLVGPSELCRALPHWLKLSPYATVRPAVPRNSQRRPRWEALKPAVALDSGTQRLSTGPVQNDRKTG
jgi:DNA-binding HxlR family transcriptional regulator